MGDSLSQKFESLVSSIGLLQRQTGNVAARSRQTRNHAGANRIRLPREHDYVSSVRVVGGEVRNAGTEAGLMLAGADDW
jgi:hypothetical protein